MRGAIVGHSVFTFAMCGLMLAVQVVIYPQFRSVNPNDFAAYIGDHSTRITAALALMAPFEVFFAAWLFLDPPDGVGRTAAFLSGLLLAIGWVSTAIWYGPLHGRLQSQPYDLDRIEQLITTNWLRTVLWVARAVIAGWFLWRVVAD